MYSEDYSNSRLANRMIAVAGCVIGGAIVMFLASLGAFAEYETLNRAGYNLKTLPVYGLIILCGVGILFRVRYAAAAAFVLNMLEMAVDITTYLQATTGMNGFFILKIGVTVCIVQLLTVIASFDDSKPEPPQRRRGPAPPRGRYVPPRKR
ncbi:MAG: hypothetical protein WC966_07640 [Bradymonadales bacterium]